MADKPTPPAEKPKRRPYHEEFAEKIIAHLEAGTAPWQKPWKPGKTLMAPHNPISGTVYRGMNRVNLALSGYDDPRWVTFKQASSQDMRVLPGSKATPVVYYQFTKEEDVLGEDGKPVIGEDGKPKTQDVELARPIMRVAHVFNAEQVEGMPALSLTDKAYEWDPVEKAESILAASGANIKHDQSDKAFYRYMTDSIHLPPKENFEEPGGYYGTALHELGHWTRHSSRLDRENGPFGTEMYAREELRAEIASWMVCQDVGIPHDPEHHAAYVDSWIKALKEDPYEIVRACRDAEGIKEYLLGIEVKKELKLEAGLAAPQKAPGKGLERSEEAMAVPGNPASEKTFLAVPYKEKEQAKKLGARWDKDQKSWYAPQGTDLAPLAKWMPELKAPEPVLPTLSPQDEFAKALAGMGLDLGGKAPVMDGKIHRVPVVGRPGGLDGAYCGYTDGVPAGWGENYPAGLKEKWIATGHALTPEAKAALAQEQAQRSLAREQERRENQDLAAQRCVELWEGRPPAGSDHVYLMRKAVPPLDIRESPSGQNLLIPLRNVEGELRGLQEISQDGTKRFMPGIEKKGCFHVVGGVDGKMPSTGEILLSEGYATGASLHMATGKPVAVAFDAGNLEPVAKKLREKFPNAKITICADNDHTKQRNIGVELAEKAAKEVGGTVRVPIFNAQDKARGCKDFNDLLISQGLVEVGKQVGLDKGHDKGKGKELAHEKGLAL